MKRLTWAKVEAVAPPMDVVVRSKTRRTIDSLVYLAINAEGLVKIGQTERSARSRVQAFNSFANLRNLSAAVGFKVTPFRVGGVIADVGSAHERAIHRVLDSERVVGEVFRGSLTRQLWKRLGLRSFTRLEPCETGRNRCLACGTMFADHAEPCAAQLARAAKVRETRLAAPARMQELFERWEAERANIRRRSAA